MQNTFFPKNNNNLFPKKALNLYYENLNENKRFFINGNRSINISSQKDLKNEFNRTLMLSQNKSQKSIENNKKPLGNSYLSHFNKNIQSKSCNTKKYKEYAKNKNVLPQ